MNKLLGSRIKALRSANNLTQEEVADQIGISRQKYARIESGVNSITLDILSKVAKILGVTVGDITKVLDETPVVQYRAGEENGDDVEVDFDSGIIYNRTKGTEFKGQAFPPFMQKIIAAEGLINYINNK